MIHSITVDLLLGADGTPIISTPHQLTPAQVDFLQRWLLIVGTL